jgi:hypothetical protein
MLEDAPDVAGQPAIHEALAGMMQDPNFALSFGAWWSWLGDLA